MVNDNALKDSSLIILGSSDYEDIACKYQTSFMGKGTQVLLFESRNSNTPLNVHSLCINRYGCSYLAGAMSTDRDAKFGQQHLKTRLSKLLFEALRMDIIYITKIRIHLVSNI